MAPESRLLKDMIVKLISEEGMKNPIAARIQVELKAASFVPSVVSQIWVRTFLKDTLWEDMRPVVREPKSRGCEGTD